MRSSRGTPLELDLFVPDWNLAIEIQGPQHSEDIYGNQEGHERLKTNDAYKKIWCREHGIKLIWMDWKGINRSLVPLPLPQRQLFIQHLVSDFVGSNYDFLWWQDMYTQQQE